METELREMAASELVRNFDHHDVHLLGETSDAVYKELRRSGVAWSEKYGGFWVISRYEDVLAALQDWRTFSSGEGMQFPPVNPLMRFIPIESDPPAQTKYRQLLAPLFTPRKAEEFETTVRDYTISLIEGLIGKTECDLVQELAERVPLYVIARLLDVPAHEQEQLRRWALDMAHPGQDENVGLEAGENMMVYAWELIQRRKERPGDDLISFLLSAELDGERLSEDEVLGFTFLLLPAGFDTTASGMGRVLLYLAEHVDVQARLRHNRTLLDDTGTEELLRLSSPVQCMGRKVTHDCSFAGAAMTKGDWVLILTGSANMDEDEFPDPEECRLDREPNRHLVFGGGPHRCLGSHLARMEVRVLLQELLDRLPPFRLRDGVDPSWLTVGHIRGISSLPVVFEG